MQDMIRFCCENCGCKIKAPETNAGKNGKCPKCGNALVVPKEININDLLVTNTEIKENQEEQQPENEIPPEENESAVLRRLPWFIDIFLYPTSAPGLINLAIFTIIPLITRILFIPGLILNFLIGFYLGWYLTECVRDSAKGNTRAPEAFAMADAREMLEDRAYNRELSDICNACFFLFSFCSKDRLNLLDSPDNRLVLFSNESAGMYNV
jgi:hypothetical protein